MDAPWQYNFNGLRFAHDKSKKWEMSITIESTLLYQQQQQQQQPSWRYFLLPFYWWLTFGTTGVFSFPILPFCRRYNNNIVKTGAIR